MFSFFKRQPHENFDHIDLDVDDEVKPERAAPDDGTGTESEEDRISMEAAQRAIEDINAEEIRRGSPTRRTNDEHSLWVTGKKYIDEWLLRQSLRDLVQDVNNALGHQAAGLENSLQEISAKPDQPRDAVGRAIKFQQEHPLLAGLLGASVVDKATKR